MLDLVTFVLGLTSLLLGNRGGRQVRPRAGVVSLQSASGWHILIFLKDRARNAVDHPEN